MNGVVATAEPAKPRVEYAIAAVILVGVSLIVGPTYLVGLGASYTLPAAGVSTFAVLYVLAQSIERFVEWVVNLLGLWEGFAEAKKKDAKAKVQTLNKQITTARMLVASAPAAARDTEKQDLQALEETKKTEESEVAQNRLDVSVFAQGLSFACAYALVSYFEYGIFSLVGVENAVAGIDRIVTALAVAGGSKGLHDLITKIQKPASSS